METASALAKRGPSQLADRRLERLPPCLASGAERVGWLPARECTHCFLSSGCPEPLRIVSDSIIRALGGSTFFCLCCHQPPLPGSVSPLTHPWRTRIKPGQLSLTGPSLMVEAWAGGRVPWCVSGRAIGSVGAVRAQVLRMLPLPAASVFGERWGVQLVFRGALLSKEGLGLAADATGLLGVISKATSLTQVPLPALTAPVWGWPAGDAPYLGGASAM